MSDNRMNIAVSVNAAFVMPLKVMLYSLAQNTDRELHIYLLYSALDASERKLIKDFVKERCHGTLHEIFIDGKLFAKYHDTKFPWSMETYYRLLLPYILDPVIEKILWLDADMIIRGNIDDFYDADMGQYYLCAAPDATCKDCANWLNLDKNQTYFNAGMLTFNLPAIRKDILQQQIFAFFEQHNDKLRFADQDALNSLMGHNVLLFDERIYNNQEHLYKKIEDDVRVIHYVSNVKPWKVSYCGGKYAACCFWELAGQCGFKRSVFSLIGNAVARHLFPIYLKMKSGHLYAIYHKLRYGQYPY